jgi:hypothetical protein
VFGSFPAKSVCWSTADSDNMAHVGFALLLCAAGYAVCGLLGGHVLGGSLVSALCKLHICQHFQQQIQVPSPAAAAAVHPAAVSHV